MKIRSLIPMALLAVAAVLPAAVGAKLPEPAPSDEAKAKAAEAAAKTAHAGKVAAYQLCKSMDRVAAVYFADAKKAGKQVGTPTPTPPCADPGAFVYPPPAAGAPAAAAAKPAAGAKPAAKKS